MSTYQDGSQEHTDFMTVHESLQDFQQEEEQVKQVEESEKLQTNETEAKKQPKWKRTAAHRLMLIVVGVYVWTSTGP